MSVRERARARDIVLNNIKSEEKLTFNWLVSPFPERWPYSSYFL